MSEAFVQYGGPCNDICGYKPNLEDSSRFDGKMGRRAAAGTVHLRMSRAFSTHAPLQLSGSKFGMLGRAPVCKMLTQLRMGRLVPGAPGGAPLSAVEVQPRAIVRCSSHNATSSEDPSGKPYINILTAGGHTFKGDLGAEPWGAGGTAPEPKDYAFAALALCTSMTVRLYANRKKWPLKHVEVEIQEINRKPGVVPDGLHAILKLEGNLTDEQRNELIRVSASCPVKQMFSGKMKNGITSEISAVVSSV